MDQIIAALPKAFIAIVVMVLTLLFLRQVQPPKTVCDAQLELFRDQQKKFLYTPESVGGIKSPELAKTMFDACSESNGPGGCFDFFTSMKKVAIDLDNIPDQCSEMAGGEAEIQNWLWKTMKLMVQMPWGSRAPASYMQRNGWFDSSELTLFCSLRHQAIRIYGAEKFSEWQESMLKSMPGADAMPRDDVWRRSVLSTACDVYR